MGTFHAYHALDKGLTVALFERNPKPAGATVRNFGQIVPSGMNSKWQAYGRKSLRIYKALQAKFDIGVRQEGSIYIASDEEEHQLIRELHQINRQNDYPSELLDPEACLARYPALRADYCRGGLFFPEELSVNPRTMIGRVQEYLEQNPLFTHFPNTLVRNVDREGTRCAVLDNRGEKYTAAKVIVCSGNDLGLLYPELVRESELQAVKLQMMRLKLQQEVRIPGNVLTGLTIRRYESFRECPSYASVKAGEGGDSFWKDWGIHLLFKQEADGSIILGDSHEYWDLGAGTTSNFDIRNDINQFFLTEAAKIFELDNWEVDTQWIGIYTQPKSKDLYQKTIGNNIHLVTGIGGKGMTAGPGLALHNINNIFGYD